MNEERRLYRLDLAGVTLALISHRRGPAAEARQIGRRGHDQRVTDGVSRESAGILVDEYFGAVIPRTPGWEKVHGTTEESYLHCGPSGAGHFVKVVHNGIEYGLMAAYAEGFNILQHANVGKNGRTVDAEATALRNPIRLIAKEAVAR